MHVYLQASMTIISICLFKTFSYIKFRIYLTRKRAYISPNLENQVRDPAYAVGEIFLNYIPQMPLNASMYFLVDHFLRGHAFPIVSFKKKNTKIVDIARHCQLF